MVASFFGHHLFLWRSHFPCFILEDRSVPHFNKRRSFRRVTIKLDEGGTWHQVGALPATAAGAIYKYGQAEIRNGALK